MTDLSSHTVSIGDVAAAMDSLGVRRAALVGWSDGACTALVLADRAPERALPLIRIEAPGGNYDYEHKYFSDETKYHCPAGLPDAVEEAIRRQALEAFSILGASGWGRLDLILRRDGTWSFLELNTSPGMTGHSLVPMAARAAGISFPDLCVEILRGAHVG